MVPVDSQRQEITARNIRRLMAEQGLELPHILHAVKSDNKQLLKDKIAGRVMFTDLELQALAIFLETTLDELATPDQVNKVMDAPKTMVQQSAAQKHQAMGVVEQLVQAVENNTTLIELVTKAYMSKLVGKVDNLGVILLHNVMVKALNILHLKGITLKPTPEESGEFVGEFMAKYEGWKSTVFPQLANIDDVVEMALVSDTPEAVLSAVRPVNGRELFPKFLTALVGKFTTNEEGNAKRVNIKQLSEEMGVVINKMKKGKHLLEEYLRTHA